MTAVPADAVHSDPLLETKLRALYGLRYSHVAPAIALRRPYLQLLDALGNPQRRLPPVIHIAGTNGKGSTMAYIRAACAAAGYRVHQYSSPHLVRFNERIVLAGQEIDNDALHDLIDRAVAANAAVNDGRDITFFEITTAMALAAFAAVPADIVLLETGMGGRLDCTNVVDNPLATIITTIGYDHVEFLGATLALIAGEKAGIMKQDAPCLIARQDHEDQVLPVFQKRSTELGAPLLRYGSDWHAGVHDGVMIFHCDASVTLLGEAVRDVTEPLSLSLPLPGLAGAHQIDNAATALACMAVLRGRGFTIRPDHMAAGLRNVHWPARLQLLAVPGLPAGTELWLDGGHNENAARILAKQIRQWQAEDDRPVHLITGLKLSKDPGGFLNLLLPLCDRVTFTTIGPEKSIDLNELKNIAAACGAKGIHCEPLPARAVHGALSQAADKPARILVAGSLYLAGEIFKIYNL